MTKAQEIEALKALAAKLGNDSYIGPWLESNIPLIEMDIASDFAPSPTWGALRDAEERAQEASQMAHRERVENKEVSARLASHIAAQDAAVARFNKHIEECACKINSMTWRS